jgi:type IV secretion system protein VirB10
MKSWRDWFAAPKRHASATAVPHESMEYREGQEREHTVPGERGIASVNRTRSLQSRVSNLLAMGLMLSLGIGLLMWYYSRTISRQAHAQQVAQAASAAKAQGEMPLPALGPIEPPEVMGSDAAAARLLGPRPELPDNNSEQYLGQATTRAASTGPGAAPVAYGGATEKSPEELTLERRLSGPAFSGATERSDATRAATPSAMSGTGVGGAPSTANSGDTSIRSLLQPTVTSAVSAQVLPTERLLLPKGAFIDCTLETAIDSSLPGLTTCITATDTFGADGKVVLLERGTKLVGETRGEVQQGSARLFVLWTEARTSTGVVVPLASPGTDELGRSGLQGSVNRHFFERFGAAILISVIDGAIQSSVQSKSGGGAVIYNPSASQDIMTGVLKSTINIPPTVTKHNGDRIQILVARDLDFRSVYELRSTNIH